MATKHQITDANGIGNLMLGCSKLNLPGMSALMQWRNDSNYLHMTLKSDDFSISSSNWCHSDI